MAVRTLLVLALIMVSVCRSHDKCLDSSDCEDHSCKSNSDCSALGRVCCDNKCSDGQKCVGQSCIVDSDCFQNQHCCEHKCSGDAICGIKNFTLVIALVVFGLAAFIIMILIVIIIIVKILCNSPRHAISACITTLQQQFYGAIGQPNAWALRHPICHFRTRLQSETGKELASIDLHARIAINICKTHYERDRSTMGLRILLLYTLFSVNYFCTSAMFCGCDYDQVCCNGLCLYGSNCLGNYCYSDSDCSFGEVCCGSSCSDSCSDNVGVIIGAVFSIIFGIFLFCVIVICCRRRQTVRTVQRPILGQRVIARTTTTTTTRNYRRVPNYPHQGPYQGQQPYGYQQGYVRPPPQYPGYGATNPIAGAYQSGSNAPPPMSVAQPPPYEEVPAVVAMGNGCTDQKNNYPQASAPSM
ncbi:uncharacterized protein LOC116286662 [Actinia tenebrosa]|uniref:Uncharacterized protein LOC116286662 n=1 Tax=Actinia tenebrosa TaxID=6105 RepID=A0A6P8GXV1_ACTTE|nr:uncharacterized protein LOC116286662 [Actinia tenebrosa]